MKGDNLEELGEGMYGYWDGHGIEIREKDAGGGCIIYLKGEVINALWVLKGQREIEAMQAERVRRRREDE